MKELEVPDAGAAAGDPVLAGDIAGRSPARIVLAMFLAEAGTVMSLE